VTAARSTIFSVSALRPSGNAGRIDAAIILRARCRPQGGQSPNRRQSVGVRRSPRQQSWFLRHLLQRSKPLANARTDDV
jgi:hypothetical protein